MGMVTRRLAQEVQHVQQLRFTDVVWLKFESRVAVNGVF